MNRFFAFFLSSYDGDTVDEKKKALFFFLGLVIALLFTLAVLIVLIASGYKLYSYNLIVYAVTLLVTVFCLFLLKNHFLLSANVIATLYISAMTMLLVLPATEPAITTLFRFANTMLFCLCFLILINFRMVLTIVYGAITVVGLLLTFIVQVSTGYWPYSAELLMHLMNLSLMMIIGTVFAALNVHLVENRIRTTKEELHLITEERNTLKRQNQIIENDMAIARQLLLSMIPKKSPMDSIAYYFKPIESIGGDYFEFIEFPMSDRIGIFISNVSERGVPAALITSMIKSTLLSSAALMNDPSALLFRLNDILSHHNNGNYITAFFGIYDPSDRRFLYANAGHNLPFLIDSSEVSEKPVLQLKYKDSGIPLAVFNNDYIVTYSKKYSNGEQVLAPKSKLVLYTDGLLESLNNGNLRDPSKPGTENKILTGMLEKNRVLSPQIFIQKIVSDIFEIHPDSKFDSDLCIICLETK